MSWSVLSSLKKQWRDAALGGRLAATTAASTSLYKRSSRPNNNNQQKQQQQQQQGCPPSHARPKKLRCRWGQDFFDFAARPHGCTNQTPYETCKDCFLKQKKDSRERKGRRSNAAAAAIGRQGFDPPSTDSSPKREARISSATIYHTNARMCGQAAGHANHPHLEVKMTFATPGGRKELRVKDAVADSGVHINIFPTSLMKAS